MGTYNENFTGRSEFYLRLIVTQTSQSISGNYSNLSWSLAVVKQGNSTAWSSTNTPWSVTINGTTSSGTWNYDFRNAAIGYADVIASGTRQVTHSSDGTKTISVSASAVDNYGYLGSSTPSGSMGLTTIARASTATMPSTDAGAAVTVTTNRADSGFTHTLTYTFGTASGSIGTAQGVGASISWTPPLTLMDKIPNATLGTGTLTTKTYDGATYIGTKTSTFTIKVPTSIVPALTGITATEGTTGVAANVGLFVQAISKLTLALTGVAGAYSSTISSSKIVVNGQTINAASGTTASPITLSGTVPIVGTVTDSRGRTKSLTVNVTFLAYTPPTLTAVSVTRALAGVANVDGTQLMLSINASVKTLMNTTERNAMTYKIYTRLHGNGAWTLRDTVALAVGVIAFNGTKVATGSPYAIASSWDILLEVTDDFATSAIQLTVATSAIFMHWDAALGLGIGRYRQVGMLDVAGPIYQNSGVEVVDTAMLAAYPGLLRLENTSDVSDLSTGHAFQIGLDSGANIAIDNNELQARNPTGTPSTMAFQLSGGDSTFGDAASTFNMNGHLNNAHLPWAMAAGSVSWTTTAAIYSSVVVTFPTGRFPTSGVLPIVTATFASGTGSSGKFVARARAISNTQTNIDVWNGDGTTLTSGVTATVHWIAIQMSSTKAAG